MNCPKCGKEVQDEALSCENCGEVFETQEDNVEKTQCEQKSICKICNSTLEDGQAFCPKCGAKKDEEQKKFCARCNAELLEGQGFCPSCGLPATAVYQPVDTNGLLIEEKKKKRKKKTIVILIVAIVCVIVVALASISSNDFNDMYSDISGELWCEIDDDGKWMKLDSNPNNTEDDDAEFYAEYYSIMKPCAEKIEQINVDLGFSTSLMEKMNSTTALQGIQTEENDKYKVTWSYHPDNGLEVMYEIK